METIADVANPWRKRFVFARRDGTYAGAKGSLASTSMSRLGHAIVVTIRGTAADRDTPIAKRISSSTSSSRRRIPNGARWSAN
jgi:hypothetical protein